MDSFVSLLIQWSGVVLGVILGICVILSTNAGSVTKSEKTLDRDEDRSHYLMTNSMGGFFAGFLILVGGIVINFLIGWLAADAAADSRKLIAIAAEVIIAVVTAVVFLSLARKSRCARILVDGDRIEVHPAFGKVQKTAFSEIRTVKKNGGDTARESTSLVIRPNGGSRFTVTKSMKNFDRFARQVEKDVSLPNLTKKQKRAEG